LKQKWYVAWKHDLDWSLLYCPPRIGHLFASPLNPGQAYRPPGISGLLLQCAPGEIIKLGSPYWYQQTSLPS